MNWLRSTILLAAVAGAVVACDRADDDALTPADVTAIAAVAASLSEAIVAGDYERALAQRTDDVVWMPPDGPALEGKAAVLQALGQGPRAAAFTLTSTGTDGSDDIAYDRGTFTYTVVMGSDTINTTGKYLTILRRQPDNTWKVAVETWNQPSPPPPAPR